MRHARASLSSAEYEMSSNHSVPSTVGQNCPRCLPQKCRSVQLANKRRWQDTLSKPLKKPQNLCIGKAENISLAERDQWCTNRHPLRISAVLDLNLYILSIPAVKLAYRSVAGEVADCLTSRLLLYTTIGLQHPRFFRGMDPFGGSPSFLISRNRRFRQPDLDVRHSY